MRPVLLPSLAVALCAAAFTPTLSEAARSTPHSPLAPKRDTEPVVIKGSALGTWSVPANQTVKLPFMDLAGEEACQSTVDPTKIDPTSPPNPGDYDPTGGGIGVPDPTGPTGGAVTYDPNACPPQDYAKPEVDTAAAQDGVLAGTPVDLILGYRYDRRAGGFHQIPFQVDEVFTRYLDNSRSGFALYSGQDQHTTYAYDREGFRYTDSSPDDPCVAIPRMVGGTRLKALPDPVPGLDNNDEIAFMYADAGPRAPKDAALPAGIADAQLVSVADPFDTAKPRYVYAMRSTGGANGAKPAYDASNGYVRYQRDADAGRFALSKSSYQDYGNAPPGPYCDPKTGKLVTKADGSPETAQRRPLDTATSPPTATASATTAAGCSRASRSPATTARASAPTSSTAGRRARSRRTRPRRRRAAATRRRTPTGAARRSRSARRSGPSGRCARRGAATPAPTSSAARPSTAPRPVRRRWLRVHVIPPLDGIYAQWDFNAGRVDTFYNPRNSDKGFPIDGRNDEVFGNLDDPCNDNYDQSDTGAFTQGYRQAYKQLAFGKYSFCDSFPYHLSIDLPDPTVSDANARSRGRW